jgi:hypothetical protein
VISVNPLARFHRSSLRFRSCGTAQLFWLT